ncbi:related to Mitochondrial import inner membrane translocase subunit TIM50 [Saccharomycodes ludwigii]|uniref:Mitochondrial import inner membrane translocase subunit TIM50 n=1 Tax=Saccharomycodes ludwigii TaxID=36035 RepID=A0A376B5G1_9ASCO|nr:hypothetical protein SCDLUD_002001 [Saccharomycodes ludwigii]KAH3902186.1 hypothetical protein SCDLUD_002001 [Saccharomycodes ludwigii]SSD59881.1 related to Mitochondrial import inner membrane translocase subunit TIM50 [Saccharomycodes ludwigii]
MFSLLTKGTTSTRIAIANINSSSSSNTSKLLLSPLLTKSQFRKLSNTKCSLLRIKKSSEADSDNATTPNNKNTLNSNTENLDQANSNIESKAHFHERIEDLKQPKSSVLTDDLLFKAGIDVEQPTSRQTSMENDVSIDKGEHQSNNTNNSEQDSTDSTASGKSRRSKRTRKSSTDIKRERYANIFYIFLFSSIIGYAGYMARDWEDNEPQDLKKDISNGYTPQLMYQRFKRRFNSLFSYFQEPPFEDLLPPPPPPPYQRPLTLVLALEDLLVHSEWSQKYGWRTAKRPGCDYFLGYLSQYYEIVLFSSNYMMYSEKIAEKLDPIHAFVTYNLFKEHCVYKDGEHIKDLSKLNRDMGKTIIIDTDPKSYSLQPDNALPLKPWDGTPDDELLKLIPFLEYLVTQQVNDIRPILNSFQDKYTIPDAFNKRVELLREKFYKDNANKLQGNWALKLLGVQSGSATTAKFPLDMIREEGEKNYIKFKEMVDEEKEKIQFQQEKMAGSQTFTLKDYVEGNIPSPEEQMKMQLAKQEEIDAEFEKYKKEKKLEQQQKQ